MVTDPRRGEVWWGEIEDVGRRPFLIMSRTAAIPVLHSVLAAPVTRTIRDIPTELRLGPDDGMPAECVASFDNLRVDLQDGTSRLAMAVPPVNSWISAQNPFSASRAQPKRAKR